MTKETVKARIGSKDINCPVCIARAGESCYLQVGKEEQVRIKSVYRRGDEYIPERVHLARVK